MRDAGNSQSSNLKDRKKHFLFDILDKTGLLCRVP